MLDIFLIFIGLSIGNYFFAAIGRVTYKTANDRIFFQFVVIVAIYVVLFSGWFSPAHKLVQ
jgi:hypothetical protein